MHRTIRSARPAAALALAGTLVVAATLVVPGAAFADPTEPTPVTTTSSTPSTTTTTTTVPSATTTSTDSATSSTTTTPPTTTTPTTTTTSPTGLPATNSSTTSTASAPTATAVAKAKAKTRAAAAAAAAAVPESGSAAAFIASTLAARGDHYVYPGSTFFDGGNSIDAILALDAVGTQVAQADAAYDYLDANVGGYMGADFASQYAGPTAKALLAAVAHGADPTDVGPDSLDLLAALHDAEGAVTPGRFSDLPVDCGFDPCDYSNTIGQSLALIALARAGEPLSTDSVSFLLAQQCADGGFRGALEGAGCTSDPDATAFATQALVASGLALLCGTGADSLPARVSTALGRGLDHLEDLQAPSGALTSADGDPNANTTGVAAQAFYAGGRTVPADAATAFLVTLQVGPTAPVASRGGIAFTTADRTTLETAPATPTEQTAFDNAVDRALRATPQAALALAGGSLVDVAAAGVQPAPPASACPAPPVTTTTTTTTTGTTGASTTGPTAPAGGAGDPADPASATPGALALTGTNVAAMTLLGALLLLAGAGALVLARRKGVHA